VTASGAAGSLAGSAIDAARWARALYGGDVLEPASLAAMVAVAATNADRRGGRPYGLGVQAYPVLGRPALGHSGRFLGFQGAVRYFPGNGLTIAVLTNQSRTDPATLVRSLVALAAPDPAPCSACPERH
jgi:CubicO group peptidase (beta-lactamase class C family)